MSRRSLLGMAGTLALAAAAWRAQQDAERRRTQAENLVDFMLGDLRERAEEIGRLDLLESVGEHVIGYFGELGARDLDDRALAQQSRALTQVGEVQLALGNSERALAAFDEAWRRSAELAARHRADRRLLFDRGQAEFWVGYVHLERGDMAAAWEWMTRYRDSAMQLSLLEPEALDARLELAYGESNLGVLAYREGRLVEAAAAFRQATANIRRLVELAPERDDFHQQLAESLSWEGSILERQGKLAESLQRFQEAADIFARLHQADPMNRAYEARLVAELGQLGRRSLLAGDFTAGLDYYEQALGHADDLLRHDPRNLNWRRQHAVAQLAKAEALQRLGRHEEADAHARAGLDEARLLAESDPTNTDWTQLHARAQAGRSAIALDRGDLASAQEAIAAALEIKSVAPTGSDLIEYAGRVAELQLVAGDVSKAAGDGEAAAAYWRTGLAALQDISPDTVNLLAMRLQAELLERLGRCAEAGPVRARLATLEAWTPETICRLAP